MYGREQKCVAAWGKRYRLEHLSIDERIILKCILKKCSVRIWPDLSQGSVYWKAFVAIKTVHFIKGRTFIY